MLLLSGFGRHWPVAHGVFLNNAMDICAWITEGVHIRLSSFHKGGDLTEAVSPQGERP